MIALLIGLIVGFLMCIPVGPINIWVVNTQMRKGFVPAFSIALGGSFMDFVYFMMILMGLSFFTITDWWSFRLKVIGVVFLFLFGLKELFVSNDTFDFDRNVEVKRVKAHNYFLIGVLIYASNPTLIATMTGLAAVIKSWQLFTFTSINYFFLSLGLAVGSASWFYVLIRLIQRYQNKIPKRFFVNFNRLCGVLIVLFSFYMGFKVYQGYFL